MKRLAAYIAALAAVLAVAALGALMILRRMYPPERLKAMALEKAQTALGRDMRIGSVRLGLMGVDLEDIAISEAPRFSAGTFLEARQLRVRPKLLPLLRREIEIADVTLSDWECRVVKRPDGSFNFSSLGGAEPAEPAGKRSSGRKIAAAAARGGLSSEAGGAARAPSTAWRVDRLRSSRGKLIYEDKASGIAVSLEKLDADARAIRPNGEFPLSLAFAYRGAFGKTAHDGSVDFRGDVDLGGGGPPKFSLRLEPLKLEYDGLRAQASGSVRDTAAPEVDLKISVPQQPPEAWKALSLPAGIGLPGLEASLDAKQRGNLISIEGLQLKGGASTGPDGIRIPPLSLKVAGDARSDGTEVSVRSCEIGVGGFLSRAHGRLQSPKGKGATIQMDLETNSFSLAEVAGFFHQARGLDLQGRASAKLHADGPLSAPALDGSCEFRGVGANWHGQRLSDLGGTIRFSPALIDARSSGRFNNGDLKLEVSASDYRSAPNLKLTGSLSELDLSKLPSQGSSAPAGGGPPSPKPPEKIAGAPAARPIHSSGKFTIGKISHPNFNASPASLEWSLGQLQDVGRLTGSAQFRIGAGHFDKLAGMAEQKPLVKAALLPLLILQKASGLLKIPLFPSFDKVDFSEITGNYAFDKGRMTIKESHLDSNAAYVSATGWADLAKDELDLHISTKLGTQLGLKLSGPVGFTVKGSLSSPTVRPDVAAILKQPIITNAVEQGKKLLQNLFK